MHFHQVLLKDGLNVFFENESKGFELTETALSYIAGLLIHSPSLLAITNPSTNSYKRLFSGFEAPNRAFFSFSNRKASIRIPVYVKTLLKRELSLDHLMLQEMSTFQCRQCFLQELMVSKIV